MRMTRRDVWGIVLIFLGGLLFLDSMGVAPMGALVRDYWPLLLVAIGLWMLLGRERRPAISGATAGARVTADASLHDDAVFGDVDEQTSASSIRHSTVFGDLNVRVLAQDFRGGSVTTVFGDVRIDMSGASLAPGEHRLDVSGAFGDVDLLLPQGTAYAFQGSMLFGDVSAGGERRSGFGSSLRMESPDFREASRKMVLRASGVFGSVNVR